jgi:glycosyl transferase family 25
VNPDIPFLVINLERSIDRWQSIEEQATAHGISVERVPAVDGNAIPPAEWHDFNLRKFALCHGRRPKGAEYGCYMSHLRALELVVERNVPYAVILEDDAGFLPDTTARLASLIESGLRFDVVKLFNHRVKGFVSKHKTAAGDDVGRCTHGPLGSAMAYFVTKDGASRLLESLRPMFLPYDIALERGWAGGTEIYLTRNPIIQPSGMPISTIGDYRATKFPRIMRIPTAMFRGYDYVARTIYAFTG